MCLFLFYVLFWLERIYIDWKQLDLVKVGSLIFKEFDNLKYFCIQLVYIVGCMGGFMFGVLNVVNEQVVVLFLEEKIVFLDILKLIEYVCEKYNLNY